MDIPGAVGGDSEGVQDKKNPLRPSKDITGKTPKRRSRWKRLRRGKNPRLQKRICNDEGGKRGRVTDGGKGKKVSVGRVKK